MNRVAHFHRQWRNGSSVRSGIGVARPVIRSIKLRRSDISKWTGDMPPRWGWELFLDAGFYIDAAPPGLGHRSPGEILKALGQMEAEIQQGMKELEGRLK